MLAQNFKTAAELGLAEIEVESLIKVLGMMERGEIRDDSSEDVGLIFRRPGVVLTGFNMDLTYGKTGCGAVACICGWAEYVGQLEPLSLMTKAENSPDLYLLFVPWAGGRVTTAETITLECAAIALRNYLTHGEPRWHEIFAVDAELKTEKSHG